MNNIFKTICLVLTGAALASCTLDFPKESEYPFLSGNTGQTPEITFSGQKDIAVGKTGGEFKGSFNVRVTPELHRSAYFYAHENGLTLNELMSRSLKNYLDEKNIHVQA